MKNGLQKWTVAVLAVSALAGCAMVGYGECFSRCGGNMPTSYGAPADPTRGALLGGTVYGSTEKYTIQGFSTLERMGEQPGAAKVNAQAYVPNVTAQEAQGSAWFNAVFGRDYIDPVTLRSREGLFPADAPLVPPGIYRLSARASVVEKLTLSGKYYPFRSPPQSTTIVVEAGKWTVLEQKIHVDESTEPMTITVDYWQAGKEMLPLKRKGGGSSFSPEFVIADPLPPSAPSASPLETGAP